MEFGQQRAAIDRKEGREPVASSGKVALAWARVSEQVHRAPGRSTGSGPAETQAPNAAHRFADFMFQSTDGIRAKRPREVLVQIGRHVVAGRSTGKSEHSCHAPR